jgi:hypothetical protein
VHALASALASDLGGTGGRHSGAGAGAEAFAAYSPRSDVRYMGDTMVPAGGEQRGGVGGIGLELAGVVPNGLEIDK